MESIAPYDGDPELLAQVERFWYVIQDVPFFTRRMKALHLLSSWSSSLMEVVEPLEALDAACARVLSSGALKDILAIVLELGNHMNRGTDFADAQGFKLRILPRLAQTKSRDGKTNLLRYLLGWIRKNAPELISLPSELSICSAAAKVRRCVGLALPCPPALFGPFQPHPLATCPSCSDDNLADSTVHPSSTSQSAPTHSR